MSLRCRLNVEELDQRILPSNSPSTLPLPSFAPVLVAPPSHELAGQGRGTYSGGFLFADAGQRAVLKGTADLASMGHVTVTGTIVGPGFIAQGRAWGSLTFTNSLGSVSVALEGPLQTGFSWLPQHFDYRVQSVSGAYLYVRDHGTLTINWHPAPGILERGSLVPSNFGTFTLMIAGGHKPPRSMSGIDGVAMVGPIEPLPMPGVPDSRPLPGAIISIEPANGGAEITRITADAEGHFTIKLPPGRYRLVPLPPKPGEVLPMEVPQVVVVYAGQYTHVTVNYDSGIA